MPTVIETVRVANRANVPVVLNPSPLRDGFPWGKCCLDTLIVNAGEAQTIFGLRADNLPAGLVKWQRALARRRIERLIITQGARPTICVSAAGLSESSRLSQSRRWTLSEQGMLSLGHLRPVGRAAQTSQARFATPIARARWPRSKPGAQESIPDKALTERAVRRLNLRAAREQ